ncbi:Chromate resistance protein ChrB [Nonomuraea sp. NPDC049152]|uniref:Chromate resistance protein ChrB n=1 Tax=Nonomuraea sp. NPDC049152 TaxID=3154350 RepID=UPI0033C14647
MDVERERRDWVLVSISTGAVASLRVHVWRQLHKLGAVYVQQSVCILPDRPAVGQALARLLARVRDQGGQARTLRLQLSDPQEIEALVAEQRTERDAEYAEVLERVPQFLAELQQETARGRATYAEVEESEADLERFARWLSAIEARDYFQAAGGDAARAAVQDCRTALATFEQAALAADTTAEPARPAWPAKRRLRAADQD